MKRILIFGNSGSGKSTLARAFSDAHDLAYLDLDTVAWKQDQPGVREALSISIEKLDRFTGRSEEWVIEGCYSGLLGHVAPRSTKMIFMNPGVETCVQNCRARPWEPHKYESKKEQDKRLDFLITWVRDYEVRDDEFSLNSHRQLFDAFAGNKRELQTNEEADALRKRLPEHLK